MAYTEGRSRDEALLLTASVEDDVTADDAVRSIDAFVDELDPGEAGFHRSPPVLELGEEVPDLAALAVEGRLVGERDLAASSRRNAGA